MSNMRIFSKHYEAEVQRRKDGAFVHVYANKGSRHITTQEFPTRNVRASVERYLEGLDQHFEEHHG